MLYVLLTKRSWSCKQIGGFLTKEFLLFQFNFAKEKPKMENGVQVGLKLLSSSRSSPFFLLVSKLNLLLTYLQIKISTELRVIFSTSMLTTTCLLIQPQFHNSMGLYNLNPTNKMENQAWFLSKS